MTTHELRKLVRQSYPHIKVSIKTVSFQDLARADAKFLYVEGAKELSELQQINQWAKEAGVIPDTSIRVFRNDTKHVQT
jgi:hypothetical protein